MSPNKIRSSDNNDIDVESEGKKVPLWRSYRFLLAFIGFFGFVNLYAQRVNMSVAMVCMINHTAVTTSSQEAFKANDSACVDTSSDSAGASMDGEFTWEKPTQGLVLSAFFWGYLVTQIPGGWLAERFGGKGVLGYSMLVCGIASILTPVGARLHPYVLITLRIIKGLGQGVVFPAAHAIWANWAPPLERSKLIGFTYAGCQIGNVITLPVSALLCEYGFDGGWPSIFYILGALGVLWCAWWLLMVSDTPAQHKRISKEEREYIEQSIGIDNEVTSKRSELGTPWKAIFTSPAVWAIITAHTCCNWGTYTLLTNTPTYMKEILKFNIKANGFLSAIPYIFFWITINVAGVIADWLISKGIKTAIVRKIFLCIGSLVPGISLIITGYISCEYAVGAVAVLTVATGFGGCQYAGVMVNHVDIAPPFSGILFGISNTVATFSGIFAPMVIGALTKDGTQEQWQLVFYVAAAIYATGAVIFSVFARGEVQEWAKPYMAEESKQEAEEKIKLNKM